MRVIALFSVLTFTACLDSNLGQVSGRNSSTEQDATDNHADSNTDLAFSHSPNNSDVGPESTQFDTQGLDPDSNQQEINSAVCWDGLHGFLTIKFGDSLNLGVGNMSYTFDNDIYDNLKLYGNDVAGFNWTGDEWLPHFANLTPLSEDCTNYNSAYTGYQGLTSIQDLTQAQTLTYTGRAVIIYKSDTYCYECHEELLHNPVFIPEDILRFSELVRKRGLGEDKKTASREKLAGRIRLLHDVIEAGLRTLNKDER